MTLAAMASGLILTHASAQNGPPDPAAMVEMRVERMNDTLKLSKAQQKQVTAIYTEAQTANRTLNESLREANQALSAAIKSNDTNAMSQAANTIGSLIAQITVNNAKAEAAIFAQLTPDQQAKYEPGGGMRGMGMGGPGFPQSRRGGPPQE